MYSTHTFSKEYVSKTPIVKKEINFLYGSKKEQLGVMQ